MICLHINYKVNMACDLSFIVKNEGVRTVMGGATGSVGGGQCPPHFCGMYPAGSTTKFKFDVTF